MPSTVQTYGDSSPALRSWVSQERAMLREKLRAALPDVDAQVEALRIARPLEEDCDYMPGHAAGTCQVSWSRHDFGERIDYLVTCCWDCVAAVLHDAWSGGTTDAPQVLVGLLQNTMRVQIHLPAEDVVWAPEFIVPVARYLVVSTSCPQCGQLRGEPIRRDVNAHGSTLSAHSWRNPCGHVETPDALAAEDVALAGQAAA